MVGRKFFGHIFLSNSVQHASLVLRFLCAMSLSTSWILGCMMIQWDPITNWTVEGHCEPDRLSQPAGRSEEQTHRLRRLKAWMVVFAQVQESRNAFLLSFSSCDKLFCCRSIHVHQPRYKMRESASCLPSEQSDSYLLWLHHIYAKLCVRPCCFIRHLSQLSAVQVGCPACSNVSRLLLSDLSS